MLIGVILPYTIKFDRNYSFFFFNVVSHTYADQTSLLPTAHILLVFFCFFFLMCSPIHMLTKLAFYQQQIFACFE